MRKQCKIFYFSVEGETEKWYLDWLQAIINDNQISRFNVKIKSTVDKNPLSYIKRLPVVSKTVITHVFDRESNNDEHVRNFVSTLDKMDEAQTSGKSIVYKIGYSNYTFDLWIILHKMDCNTSYCDRNQYLSKINQAFDESFLSMNEYKEELNFKRVLSKLSLDDVINAIHRAERIEQHNSDCYREHEYKKYKFFIENPSLSIHKSIKEILSKCGLI